MPEYHQIGTGLTPQKREQGRSVIVAVDDDDRPAIDGYGLPIGQSGADIGSVGVPVDPHELATDRPFERVHYVGRDEVTRVDDGRGRVNPIEQGPIQPMVGLSVGIAQQHDHGPG